MSLKKNVIANFIGQGWAALMGLAFIPIYIKYLGVEAYGLIGFYAVMQAWFTLLDMGITQTLNREMARFTAGAHTSVSIHNLLRSLEIISISIALLVCIFVWQSSEYIATHWLNSQKLSHEELIDGISLMGIVIALRFIEGIYKGALLGLQRQVLVNIVTIISATLRYGGVVAVLIFYAASIRVFFAWQAFTSIVSILMFVVIVYKQLPHSKTQAKFSKRAIIEIRQFASGVFAITFLALLLTQVDKILLSKLITLEAYGYYSLATVIANCLGLVALPITQAIYPRLVESVTKNNHSELVNSFHLGSQLIASLVTPLSVTLIFFGQHIIYLWSGDSNLAEQTMPLLIPLVIGGYLNCLVWMPYQLQLAHGWMSFGLKANLIAVSVLVPIILIITPIYGAEGAAWAWALLNLGYVTLGMHYMYRHILTEEKWRWYLTSVITPLLISVVAAYFFSKVIQIPIDKVSAAILILLMGAIITALLTLSMPTLRKKAISYISNL